MTLLKSLVVISAAITLLVVTACDRPVTDPADPTVPTTSPQKPCPTLRTWTETRERLSEAEHATLQNLCTSESSCYTYLGRLLEAKGLQAAPAVYGELTETLTSPEIINPRNW